MKKSASEIMDECQEALTNNNLNSEELDEIVNKEYVPVNEIVENIKI